MKKQKKYLQFSFIPGAIKARLQLIGKHADAEGIRAFVVGGFVRDIFFKRIVWDLDIVTESDPLPIISALSGRVTKHSRYMTYTVVLSDEAHIDFATARKEVYNNPAELPVVSSGSMQEDLCRRDFTCNAMAVGLNKDNYGQLYDPYQGELDLKKKLLRIFHDRSFEDDPTRIFRAARFLGRYNFTLEKRTKALITIAICKKYPDKLSRNRIANEFKKIVLEPNPQKAILLLSQWGLMGTIHRKLISKKWKSLKLYPRPLSFSLTWFFQGIGLDEIEGILDDLRFDRKMIDTVISMSSAAQALQKKTKITDSLLEEFCHDQIYDVTLLKHMPHIEHSIITRLKRYRMVRSAFLNGADLHQMGYVPGKKYGEILRSLRRGIWQGKVKTRQDAILFVRKINL